MLRTECEGRGWNGTLCNSSGVYFKWRVMDSQRESEGVFMTECCGR